MQREMCTAFREVIRKVGAYIQGQYFIHFAKHNRELLKVVTLHWHVSLRSVQIHNSETHIFFSSSVRFCSD